MTYPCWLAGLVRSLVTGARQVLCVLVLRTGLMGGLVAVHRIGPAVALVEVHRTDLVVAREVRHTGLAMDPEVRHTGLVVGPGARHIGLVAALEVHRTDLVAALAEGHRTGRAVVLEAVRIPAAEGTENLRTLAAGAAVGCSVLGSSVDCSLGCSLAEAVDSPPVADRESLI